MAENPRGPPRPWREFPQPRRVDVSLIPMPGPHWNDIETLSNDMGQAQGRELPFDIGEKHSCLVGKTVWSAHDGRRKVNEPRYAEILHNLTSEQIE